jgi:hypothetical protein
MHGGPRELCLRPRHRLAAEHLHDGRPPADRRHGALVLVGERLRVLARDPMGDRLARVLAGLEGDRPELRQNLLGLLVHDGGDVAERVDLAMGGNRQVRPDTSRFPCRPAPQTRVCAFSSSPDFSVTRVGETDATIAPVLTSTVRSERALAVYLRIFGLNMEKSSGPASTRVTRASSCGSEG